MKCKDFKFSPKAGFSGSAGRYAVKGFSEGGRVGMQGEAAQRAAAKQFDRQMQRESAAEYIRNPTNSAASKNNLEASSKALRGTQADNRSFIETGAYARGGKVGKKGC